MTARVLDAWIDGDHIGALHDVEGVWAFQYTAQWLASPHCFALSPHLPLRETPILDGSTVRPVQWYFDNLLPEEGQRVLLSAEVNVDAADAFGLLRGILYGVINEMCSQLSFGSGR